MFHLVLLSAGRSNSPWLILVAGDELRVQVWRWGRGRWSDGTRRGWGQLGAELGVDPADGFGDLVIKAGVAVGEQVLGAGKAGDGGGSQAEDAEGISELVEVGIGEAGFNQATGEDADEGDLFDET